MCLLMAIIILVKVNKMNKFSSFQIEYWRKKL